jgi:uncharacterized OsmC-like protein
MSEREPFSLTLDHLEGFEFETHFDWDVPLLLLDEPEPIGHRKGPNAARLVGAAVGNCLSASLLFCLEKARMELQGMKTAVKGFLERNEAGRLRVVRLDVHITVDVKGEKPARVGRCLELFEDYCVVTGSIRKAIEVNVLVTDPQGTTLMKQGEVTHGG